MTRYRLLPTPEQEWVLREHCAHARIVWNLAVEQLRWPLARRVRRRPGAGPGPQTGDVVGIDRGVARSTRT